MRFHSHGGFGTRTSTLLVQDRIQDLWMGSSGADAVSNAGSSQGEAENRITPNPFYIGSVQRYVSLISRPRVYGYVTASLHLGCRDTVTYS